MQLSDVLKAIQPCDIDRPYIFISYSAKDQERVWQDVLHFQQMGYNIWLDEKNLDKTQDSWRSDALTAIRDMNCSLLVFYVSRNSLVSQPCFSELSCTVEDYTRAVHFGPVKFVAVDVEPIDDIVQFSRDVYNEIRGKDIPKSEKTTQAITLNNCIEQFFNSNNEKVRVKPHGMPNRKMDYYEEITAAFPDDTRVLPAVPVVEPITEPAIVSAPERVPQLAPNPQPVAENFQMPEKTHEDLAVDLTENDNKEGRTLQNQESQTVDAKKDAYWDEFGFGQTHRTYTEPLPTDPVQLANFAMSEGNREIRARGASGSFLPAGKLTPKQLRGAVGSIAKGEKEEDVLGMMDDTLFGSGKSGVVLTKTKLYSSWAKKHPIDIHHLVKIEQGKSSCHLLLTYDDYHQEDIFYNNDYLALKAVLDVYLEARNQR